MVDAAALVKRVRALSGITRKDLAALSGVSPSTVGRIEQGDLDPTWGVLSRILEATGFRVSGDTVASAGDATAIIAARPILESRNMACVDATLRSLPADVAESADRWVQRWGRAGWSSAGRGNDRLIALAVNAGNAAKISRRSAVRRTVVAPDGWQELARQIGAAGIEYAVSGLVAARDDRATSSATAPVVYVDDPSAVIERLRLEEAVPGKGVLLLSASGDELAQAEEDGGIRFVSRMQGILDAFAGPGREPDKAEDELRNILALSV